MFCPVRLGAVSAGPVTHSNDSTASIPVLRRKNRKRSATPSTRSNCYHGDARALCMRCAISQNPWQTPRPHVFLFFPFKPILRRRELDRRGMEATLTGCLTLIRKKKVSPQKTVQEKTLERTSRSQVDKGEETKRLPLRAENYILKAYVASFVLFCCFNDRCLISLSDALHPR